MGDVVFDEPLPLDVETGAKCPECDSQLGVIIGGQVACPACGWKPPPEEDDGQGSGPGD